MKNVENTTSKKQKMCVLSSGAPKPVADKLKSLGFEVLLLPVHPCLNSKEGHHPDMQLCRVSDHQIVYAPGVDGKILAALQQRHFTLIKGATILKSKYPLNIAYNVLVADKLFFHNVKHTDAILKKILQDRGQTPVPLKQGYSGCSGMAFSTDSGKTLILTGDKGLQRACAGKDVECILCEGVENIRLRGYDHGFVGGCCGKDGRTLYTCGSIEKTFYNGEQVVGQLNKNGIKVVNLWGGRLRDIGGILIL